jgi:hypothetical protein
MDDLFQYLIWGIIIFSFISSFLKKKGQPKPPLPGTKPKDPVSYPRQESNDDFSTVVIKQDEYDILRELENLFKDETKIPHPYQQQKPVNTEDYYAGHEIKDKDLELEDDKRTQRYIERNQPVEYKTSIEERGTLESKTNLEKLTTLEQMSLEKTRVKIDSKTEANAKEFERVLAGPLKQRAAITEFNSKLKNPRIVREYILFSEILGKPKALRR